MLNVEPFFGGAAQQRVQSFLIVSPKGPKIVCDRFQSQNVNWSSFQLAIIAHPQSVTCNDIAPSARMSSPLVGTTSTSRGTRQQWASPPMQQLQMHRLRCVIDHNNCHTDRKDAFCRFVGLEDQVHHTQQLCRAEATRESGASKLADRLSLRKINVTKKSPFGLISPVTEKRTDTTLDLSQKAEKVCCCVVAHSLTGREARSIHGRRFPDMSRPIVVACSTATGCLRQGMN